MDQFSDEVSNCVSPFSPNSAGDGCKISRRRRENTVSALNEALAAKQTVLSPAKLLWIAGEFEVEIFNRSEGNEIAYEKFRADKLGEVGASAADQQRVTDASWAKIQCMKEAYSQPLQASFAVIVSALRKDDKLPEKERHTLKSFKRLILGLVLFLSAERAKVPSRFDVAKLVRLEAEVVQILRSMLKKIEDGTIKVPGETAELLAQALCSNHGQRNLASRKAEVSQDFSSWDSLEKCGVAGGLKEEFSPLKKMEAVRKWEESAVSSQRKRLCCALTSGGGQRHELSDVPHLLPQDLHNNSS